MERVLPLRAKSIHFIGIGGIGMSGLANLLVEKGYQVSGSDIRENRHIEYLRAKGVKVKVPHSPGLVRGKDLICFSSAIPEDNVELKEARSLRLPIIKRGELLAYLFKEKQTIAVAGSHGKTTTTGLLSFIFQELGYSVSSFIGGIPRNGENSSWWGKDVFVVETDESDGTFLKLMPVYSLITNIDKEHINFYKSFPRLKEAFLKFSKSTQKLVIGCGDDENLRDISQKLKDKFITYGFSRRNFIQARNIKLYPFKSRFDLFIRNRFVFSFTLSQPGVHNVLNSLGVLALVSLFQNDYSRIGPILARFSGTRRRFEVKARLKGVLFIEDYGHHPTEIKYVIKMAKVLKRRRLVVMFQPHRYSRVKSLWKEFTTCFKGTDYLIITDIYSAQEKELKNVNSRLLAKDIARYLKDVFYVPREQLITYVPSILKRGDCFISLGAGDIDRINDLIIQSYSLK